MVGNSFANMQAFAAVACIIEINRITVWFQPLHVMKRFSCTGLLRD